MTAMRTLGYRPSRSTHSLASGRTRMLGVISFDAARYGPASILTAINSASPGSRLPGQFHRARHGRPGHPGPRRAHAVGRGGDGLLAIAPQRWVGRALAEAALDVPDLVLENDLGDDASYVDRGLPRRGAPSHPSIC